MAGKFAEACAHELESLLERLFDNPVRIPNTGMAEAPVIGDWYIVSEDHSHFLPSICRALCAREKFCQDAPGWPTLPLRAEECEAMIDDDDPRRRIVGYYGDSQRCEDWSLLHPSFAPFVSGLLFDKHTPIELRKDRELLQQFPPRKLEGMCRGWLTWRSPEALALDRRLRRMAAAHAAYEAAQERMTG